MPGEKGGIGEKGFPGEETYGMMILCFLVVKYFFVFFLKDHVETMVFLVVLDVS